MEPRADLRFSDADQVLARYWTATLEADGDEAALVAGYASPNHEERVEIELRPVSARRMVNGWRVMLEPGCQATLRAADVPADVVLAALVQLRSLVPHDSFYIGAEFSQPAGSHHCGGRARKANRPRP